MDAATDLAAAEARLERWRAAVLARRRVRPPRRWPPPSATASPTTSTPPRRWGPIDAWAAADGDDADAPAQVRAVADTLLGVAL